MKLITLAALVTLSLSSQAVQFSCSNNNQNSPQGFAALKGQLNELGGKIELTGDGIYSFGSKRETVTFFRTKRANEDQFKFAKFTGGSLFHLFYFSLPKDALGSNQKKFTGYLNFLREGVGGMAQFKLSCKVTTTNELMAQITKKFNNLVTYERLEEEGFADVIESVAKHSDLPKAIQKTLERLELSIFDGWDVTINRKSEYVVNFSNNKYESDAIRIVKNGQTQGYVFNITECNIEECYGWDALYLNADGFVLEQSF